MPESKQKKIIMAATVTAVLLASILLVVMVYQLISMSVLKAKKEKLRKEIAELSSRIENLDESIEKYQDLAMLEKLARELGMYYEGDKEYKP